MIKRLFILLSLITSLSLRAQVFAPSDIQFFIGSGSNEAYFVVDWNNSLTPRTLAWGYRWNGTKTGEDMLRDIDASDIWLEHSGILFAFGYALYGMGYDLQQDMSGFVVGSTPLEGGYANNPLNHYREGFGFTSGFWSYWTDNGANPYGTGSWVLSPVGMSDRILVNGGWDGWSFSTDVATFTSTPPGTPVAAPIPEPGTVFLIVVICLASLAVVQRRAHHQVRQSCS